MDTPRTCPCPRCNGRGAFYSFGTCFRCKGTGVIATRAEAARLRRAEREAAEAAAVERHRREEYESHMRAIHGVDIFS